MKTMSNHDTDQYLEVCERANEVQEFINNFSTSYIDDDGIQRDSEDHSLDELETELDNLADELYNLRDEATPNSSYIANCIAEGVY